ncbi:hypothetical protein D3C85_1548780 [compost metagenome]
MAAAEASKIQIKNYMHHKSLSSSDVYTQPTSTDFRNRMTELEARLGEKYKVVQILDLGSE